MRAKKVYENIEFKRGVNPKRSLGIGIERRISNIFHETKIPFPDGGAYSEYAYSDEGWRDIIKWLMDRNFDDEEIDIILRDKVMRYADDRTEYKSEKDLNTFLDFIENEISDTSGIQYLINLLDSNYYRDPNRKDRIKLNENLSFERGGDSKKSLRIGKSREIAEFLDLEDPEIFEYYEKFNQIKQKKESVENYFFSWNEMYNWVWASGITGSKKEILASILTVKYYRN